MEEPACYRCHETGHGARDCAKDWNWDNALDITSNDYDKYAIEVGQKYFQLLHRGFEDWKHREKEIIENAMEELKMPRERNKHFMVAQEKLNIEVFGMQNKVTTMLAKMEELERWLKQEKIKMKNYIEDEKTKTLDTFEKDCIRLWQREVWMYQSWMDLVQKYQTFGVF